jgi:hypothetical protein
MSKTLKYFIKDGKYVCNEGVAYDSVIDFAQKGCLGLCDCGNPEQNIRYIHNMMDLLDRLNSDTRKDAIEWKEFDKLSTSLAGNKISAQFFWYWLDWRELTNHGGSIPGWLTDTGHKTLQLLREVLYVNDNNIFSLKHKS